jgi:hypothetical protein
MSERKRVFLGLAAVAFLTTAACAPPDPVGLPGGSSSGSSNKKFASTEDSPEAAPTPKQTASAPTADVTPPPPTPGGSSSPSVDPDAKPTTPVTPPAPVLPPFTVMAQLGKRLGDNDAVANSGTSVEQLQTLLLVHVPSYAVVLTATGGALDAMKNDLGGSGSVTLNLPGSTPSGLYAIVDGALYYPNENLALQPGMDLEHFPKGVVGYVTIYPPGGGGAPPSARQESDIIWSGYEISQLLTGHAERLKSPLVVDLGGKGVTFESPRPIFDVDGDGLRDRVAWVASDNTPFLVRDRNHNGRIDGIDEMFGDGTLDRNGTGRTSKNGFQALAQYDFDGSGVIDQNDPIFHELSLWFDRNRDGITDDGELVPLSARHLTQIALDYTPVDVRGSFGNRILQKGEADTRDGRVAVYDVWFRTE